MVNPDRAPANAFVAVVRKVLRMFTQPRTDFYMNFLG